MALRLPATGVHQAPWRKVSLRKQALRPSAATMAAEPGSNRKDQAREQPVHATSGIERLSATNPELPRQYVASPCEPQKHQVRPQGRRVPHQRRRPAVSLSIPVTHSRPPFSNQVCAIETVTEPHRKEGKDAHRPDFPFDDISGFRSAKYGAADGKDHSYR